MLLYEKYTFDSIIQKSTKIVLGASVCCITLIINNRLVFLVSACQAEVRVCSVGCAAVGADPS